MDTNKYRPAINDRVTPNMGLYKGEHGTVVELIGLGEARVKWDRDGSISTLYRYQLELVEGKHI